MMGQGAERHALGRCAAHAGIAALVAIFTVLASPLRDALLIGSFLRIPDREPQSGPAVVLVRNLDKDDIRLVSLKMHGAERLAEAPDGTGWPLAGKGSAAGRCRQDPCC
jgi:hypothetical protein